MAKQIVSDENARRSLKSGLDQVADAVKITLGPRGRNAVLEKSYGTPTITNDGVSIAKEITLKDKVENMGAEIIKEVASKTNELAGDGTTTAMVLTQSLTTEGMKRIAMGANAMGVRRGMDAAVVDAVGALQKMAKEIKSDKEIKQVATISAESDDIGEKIADTIKKVGKDGVVTVEESQSFGVESEVVEGLEFDKGYVSPYMITDTERMEATYKEPYILLTDRKISGVQEILPLLEKLAAAGTKDLVIIAEDVEGEALTTFVVNKLRGAFNTLAVKAPGYGDRKKDILEDIAVITGGMVVSEDKDVKLEEVTPDMLGRAARVVATKEKTVIVGGKGKKADITARVSQLKKQADLADSKYDREKYDERVAKLSGGVAVIRVGAATETEMKYLKDKIEDSVNATKAAIEEGIVPGGGTALARASAEIGKKFLEEEKAKGYTDKNNAEFLIGYKIVIDALVAPLKQIAQNAGRDDASVIIKNIHERDDNSGYDASNDQIVDDMLGEGIIDPVKVTRSGLQHAASAVAILLTTEVAIAEEPQEEKGADAMPPMGGGMPGMGM